MGENKFKKSVSGIEVPKGWSIDLVGNAFEICNNLRFPISESERKNMQGEFPYYGPTKVQDFINEYRVEGKYVLIGEDGDHFLKWSELPMTLLVEGRFNVNNHAHLVKGEDNLTEWFYYYFQHRELTKYLTRQGAGRYKLTKNALSKIPILLPPISEQQSIAEILGTIDQAIQISERLIAQKELRKKWLMQNLLTGKKRLKGFEGEWEDQSLEKICKITKGEQLNRLDLGKTGIYPSYSGGISPSGYTDEWNTPENTIIISEGGNSCGYVNFVTTRFWSGGHCYALSKLTKIIIKDFLFQILKFNEPSIMRLRVGSGLPNVQKKDLEKYRLFIPPIEEQSAIAQVLQTSDQEIKLLKEKVEKLRVQKKGMMQRLLTGKVRVNFKD